MVVAWSVLLLVQDLVTAHALTGEASATCGLEGSTCSSALIQSKRKVVRMDVSGEQDTSTSGACDEGSWPDLDDGLVCGECKVLVDKFDSKYKTCNGYCESIKRKCIGAWEEKWDTCDVLRSMYCNETIDSSDAICQCSPDVVSSDNVAATVFSDKKAATGYGELSGKATDEGSGIGVPEIVTQDLAKCKRACDDHADCKSFTFCAEWHGCFLKGKVLSSSEPTKSSEKCTSFYKKSGSSESKERQGGGEGQAARSGTGSQQQATKSQGGRAARIRIASYNLYWWNAFQKNSWKGNHVTNNIKDNLKADVLGLQECDSPDLIKSRTGYESASPFKGAQGIMVKPNTFDVISRGSRDIHARGKWGPRYVTWTHLTHRSSGRKLWHFNTHWCVHSDGSHRCDSNTRLKGAKNMLAAIKEMAGDAPVVITGDFNAGMGESGLRHFQANGYTRAVDHWVDAVFFSTRHWQAKKKEVGSSAGSDHKPVIAELELLA